MAVIGNLLSKNKVIVALAFLVQFRTYLRPGTCDRLRVKQLVPSNLAAGEQFRHWGLVLNPQEDRVAGKTGLWDQSILYDTEHWIAPFFCILTSNRNPEALLWGEIDFLTEFRTATNEVGLSIINPTRYSLRHGGASEDLLSGTRTVLEVKRRGGWSTDSSLKRYAKDTRLQAEVNKLHPNTLVYGALIQSSLKTVFSNPQATPPCPVLGVVDEMPDRHQRQRVC